MAASADGSRLDVTADDAFQSQVPEHPDGHLSRHLRSKLWPWHPHQSQRPDAVAVDTVGGSGVADERLSPRVQGAFFGVHRTIGPVEPVCVAVVQPSLIHDVAHHLELAVLALVDEELGPGVGTPGCEVSFGGRLDRTHRGDGSNGYWIQFMRGKVKYTNISGVELPQAIRI